MELVTLRGKEAIPFLDEMAELRIKIFREWPYLYEGDLDTERNYLQVYEKAKDSLVILAKDQDRIVGTAMGLPAKESMEQVRMFFQKEKSELDSIYYFADLILLKEYRGKKIGLKMIREFERGLASLEHYESVYFCEIVQEKNDPRIPSDYRALDLLWESLGYFIVPNWEMHMSWLDIGSSEKKLHLMRFRGRKIKTDFSNTYN